VLFVALLVDLGRFEVKHFTKPELAVIGKVEA